MTRSPLLIAGVLLALGLSAHAARAETARAYLLIETDPDKLSQVRDQLGSLANCKALLATLIHPEIVAHVECNDQPALRTVVADEIAAKEGVRRISVMVLHPGR